jgi:hypothetical protein
MAAAHSAIPPSAPNATPARFRSPVASVASLFTSYPRSLPIRKSTRPLPFLCQRPLLGSTCLRLSRFPRRWPRPTGLGLPPPPVNRLHCPGDSLPRGVQHRSHQVAPTPRTNLPFMISVPNRAVALKAALEACRLRRTRSQRRSGAKKSLAGVAAGTEWPLTQPLLKL